MLPATSQTPSSRASAAAQSASGRRAARRPRSVCSAVPSTLNFSGSTISSAPPSRPPRTSDPATVEVAVLVLVRVELYGCRAQVRLRSSTAVDWPVNRAAIIGRARRPMDDRASYDLCPVHRVLVATASRADRLEAEPLVQATRRVRLEHEVEHQRVEAVPARLARASARPARGRSPRRGSPGAPCSRRCAMCAARPPKFGSRWYEPATRSARAARPCTHGLVRRIQRRARSPQRSQAARAGKAPPSSTTSA